MPALFWRFLDKQIDQKSNIILCDRNMGLNSDFIKDLENTYYKTNQTLTELKENKDEI